MHTPHPRVPGAGRLTRQSYPKTKSTRRHIFLLAGGPILSFTCPLRPIGKGNHARKGEARDMPRREFANEQALRKHANVNGDFYALEGSATFAKWRRLLSQDQYEIVDLRTSQGVRRAILFPKAILRAQASLDAPLRKVLAVKTAAKKHSPE